MLGQPVWLASLSRKSGITGGRLSTSVWSEQTMRESMALLRRVLGPAGDPSRERIFRMQITLCIHRAITQAELEALPDYFHRDPAVDLAGGPVEILFETERGSESTMPCHAPKRLPLDPTNKLLWFPLDCGACPPCRARAKLDADYDAKRDRAPGTIRDMLRGA
jgi:hypothetical protein